MLYVVEFFTKLDVYNDNYNKDIYIYIYTRTLKENIECHRHFAIDNLDTRWIIECPLMCHNK